MQDIFEYVKYDNTSATPCPAGLKAVNTGSTLGAECLRIKPGMEKLASRFETRRYLALLGGKDPFSICQTLFLICQTGQVFADSACNCFCWMPSSHLPPPQTHMLK